MPSTKANADEVLRWLHDLAVASNNDAGFTAAATAARGLPSARRLTGSWLYDAMLADLKDVLPGVPGGVLVKIRLGWRHAVEGKPAS